MKLTEQQIQEIILEETKAVLAEGVRTIIGRGIERAGQTFVLDSLEQFGLRLIRNDRELASLNSSIKTTANLSDEAFQKMTLTQYVRYAKVLKARGHITAKESEALREALSDVLKGHAEVFSKNPKLAAQTLENFSFLMKVRQWPEFIQPSPAVIAEWTTAVESILKSYRRISPEVVPEGLTKGKTKEEIISALMDINIPPELKQRLTAAFKGLGDTPDPATVAKAMEDAKLQVPLKGGERPVALPGVSGALRQWFSTPYGHVLTLIISSGLLIIDTVYFGLVKGAAGWALGFVFGDDDTPPEAAAPSDKVPSVEGL